MNSSINFKENIHPNNYHHLGRNDTQSTLNLQKLAPSIQTFQSSQVINKPPAVPSSKVLSQTAHNNKQQQQFYIMSESLNLADSSRKRNSMLGNQKGRSSQTYLDSATSSGQSSSFSSNRHTQSQQSVQTKMRLCQNSNNGKILAVGIVDLSRCNFTQVQRDTQFFESVKPLIEGSSFQFTSRQHGLGQMKYVYLDFSLLRLFLNQTGSHISHGDRREVLMVESIIKTDVPQSTLDLIQ